MCAYSSTLRVASLPRRCAQRRGLSKCAHFLGQIHTKAVNEYIVAGANCYAVNCTCSSPKTIIYLYMSAIEICIVAVNKATPTSPHPWHLEMSTHLRCEQLGSISLCFLLLYRIINSIASPRLQSQVATVPHAHSALYQSPIREHMADPNGSNSLSPVWRDAIIRLFSLIGFSGPPSRRKDRNPPMNS